MYHFHELQDTNLQQLAECFNLAFSDYEQPIHFTPESLAYYIKASAIDLSLSYGAFCGDEMVAFILNSQGKYQNQNVVFDAGTGVIPAHRGKKVFSTLFEYTAEHLQERGITKYYLEVLQSNHRAIAIYSKKGFSIKRSFSVLTASGPKREQNKDIAVLPYSDFLIFDTAFSVEPSFEHTAYTINQNPQLYEVLYLNDRAYSIYAKKNGAIVQMHYNDLDSLKDILSALIHRYPSAMAKNVDFGCSDVINMLTEIGFTEITKQYEMARDI